MVYMLLINIKPKQGLIKLNKLRQIVFNKYYDRLGADISYQISYLRMSKLFGECVKFEAMCEEIEISVLISCFCVKVVLVQIMQRVKHHGCHPNLLHL